MDSSSSQLSETNKVLLPCADPKWASRVPVEQLGLKMLHNPTQEALVDIVAVHGLGAIPALTWKEKHSGVNWLKDAPMLPSHVPRARIMAFGYDSIYVGRDPVKTSIYNIAKDLIGAIDRHRTGLETRPLIFIGHCFGGLVIEKAILLSPIWKPILLENIAGVILLGTPHRGSETFSSQGKVLEAIAAGVTASSEEDKLYLEAGLLEKLSTSGSDIGHDPDDFAKLVLGHSIDLCTFYETRSSDIGKLIGKPGIKEIVVNQFSARLDGQISFGLDVDHFSLNKFANPEDGNYYKIAMQVKRLYSNAISSAHVENATLNDRAPYSEEEFLACIEKMNFTPAEDELTRILRLKGHLIEEACSWILEEVEKFIQSSSPVLWIHGDAGKGKTMMSSFLIKHLKKRPSAHVYFFFCQHDSDDHRSAVSVLKSVICQILLDSSIASEKRRSLSRHLVKEFKIQGPRFLSSWSAEESLKRILEEIISELDDSLIVIDGLDECDLPSTSSIVESMLPMTMNFAVKYLLTSRNEPKLLHQKLNKYSQVRLEQEQFDSLVRNGVRTYIAARIDETEATSELARTYDSYREQLSAKAGDSFIWAALICDQIHDNGIEFLPEFLKECPKGLGPLYSRILLRILYMDSNGSLSSGLSDKLKCFRSDMSRQILRVLCAAERAFNIYELELAIDYKSCGYKNVPFSKIIEDCGGLISIEPEELRFIHLSVKNYLLEEDTQERFGLSLEQAHFDLAQNCMNFIHEQASIELPYKTSIAPGHGSCREIHDQRFQDYSVSYCMRHALEAVKSSKFTAQAKEHLKVFLSGPGGLLFYAQYRESHPECEFSSLGDTQKELTQEQKLYICAFFGFTELLENIFDSANIAYEKDVIKSVLKMATAQDRCDIVSSNLTRLDASAQKKLVKGQCEALAREMRNFAGEEALVSGSVLTWEVTRSMPKDNARTLIAAVLGDKAQMLEEVLSSNSTHINDDIWLVSTFPGEPGDLWHPENDSYADGMLNANVLHADDPKFCKNVEFLYRIPRNDNSLSRHEMIRDLGNIRNIEELVVCDNRDMSVGFGRSLRQVIQQLTRESLVQVNEFSASGKRVWTINRRKSRDKVRDWVDRTRPWEIVLSIRGMRWNLINANRESFFGYRDFVNKFSHLHDFEYGDMRLDPKITIEEREALWMNFEFRFERFVNSIGMAYRKGRLGIDLGELTWNLNEESVEKYQEFWERFGKELDYSNASLGINIHVCLGSPLQIAWSLRRHSALVAILATGEKDEYSMELTFLRCASEGWAEGLECIFNAKSAISKNVATLANALRLACRNGRSVCVDVLLSAGANADVSIPRVSSKTLSTLSELASNGFYMALIYLLPHSTTANSKSHFNDAMIEAVKNTKRPGSSVQFVAAVKHGLLLLSETFGSLPTGWTQLKTYDGWPYFVYVDEIVSFSRWQDPRVPFETGKSLDDVWVDQKPPSYLRDLEDDISLMSGDSSDLGEDETGEDDHGEDESEGTEEEDGE